MQPWREADNFFPSIAKAKNAWRYASISHVTSCEIKYRDKFPFSLCIKSIVCVCSSLIQFLAVASISASFGKIAEDLSGEVSET
jgi:hypothetical protein